MKSEKADPPSSRDTIRRLRPDDAPRYRALMLEAYEAHPDAFTSSASERAALPLEWWESRLSISGRANEAVWGALEGDVLIGVAGLGMESREKLRHKATLFGMYVSPLYRGRNVGDGLVRAVLEYAQSRAPLEVVQLMVTEGNVAARALYEQHGFVEFGVEPFAVRVGEDFVSKVHMWWRIRR
jgi:ribosomal protein S18 acetylase RimI-like enzyme